MKTINEYLVKLKELDIIKKHFNLDIDVYKTFQREVYNKSFDNEKEQHEIWSESYLQTYDTLEKILIKRFANGKP